MHNRFRNTPEEAQRLRRAASLCLAKMARAAISDVPTPPQRRATVVACGSASVVGGLTARSTHTTTSAESCTSAARVTGRSTRPETGGELHG